MGESPCNQCNNDLLFCLCFVPEALFLLAFSQAAVRSRMRELHRKAFAPVLDYGAIGEANHLWDYPGKGPFSYSIENGHGKHAVYPVE